MINFSFRSNCLLLPSLIQSNLFRLLYQTLSVLVTNSHFLILLFVQQKVGGRKKGKKRDQKLSLHLQSFHFLSPLSISFVSANIEQHSKSREWKLLKMRERSDRSFTDQSVRFSQRHRDMEREAFFLQHSCSSWALGWRKSLSID